VIQVLEPLEIRAGNTASVGEHVGDDNDASLLEFFLSTEGSGSVGTLKDDLAVEEVTVILVNSLFFGSGDQNIALFFHEISWVERYFLRRSAEADESASLCEVGLCNVNVDSVGIVDGRVVLNDANYLSSVLFTEFCGPESYCAKTLDNNCLASETLIFYKRFLNKGIIVEQSPYAVVDTETGRLGSAVNAALGDELASCTAFSVDVLLAVHVHVGIFNPGHNLLVGSEIRAKTVDLGANETLLGEL